VIAVTWISWLVLLAALLAGSLLLLKSVLRLWSEMKRLTGAVDAFGSQTGGAMQTVNDEAAEMRLRLDELAAHSVRDRADAVRSRFHPGPAGTRSDARIDS